MDIRLRATLKLPHNGGTVTAISFHPFSSSVFVVYNGMDIVEFDSLTGALLGRLTTGVPGGKISHLHNLHSHNILTAIMEDWSIVVWDLNRYVKVKVISPTETKIVKKLVATDMWAARRPVVASAVSFIRPMLFFIKEDSPSVHCVDLVKQDKAYFKLSNEQPTKLQKARNKAKELRRKSRDSTITDICVHPQKAVLATASTDGLLRIWEYEAQTMRMTLDESLSTPAELKSKGGHGLPTGLVFHPTEDYLIVADTSGRVVVWDIQSLSQGTILTIEQVSDRPVDWVGMHPWHPAVVTMSGGEVQSWRLMPPGTGLGGMDGAGMLRPSGIIHKTALGSLLKDDESRFVDTALFHPRLNFLLFIYTPHTKYILKAMNHNGNEQHLKRTTRSIRLFFLSDKRNMLSVYPVLHAVKSAPGVFLSNPPSGQLVPQRFVFADRRSLRSFYIVKGESRSMFSLPGPDNEGRLARALRVMFSPKQHCVLVLMENDNDGRASDSHDRRWVYYGEGGNIINSGSGRDCCFVGESDESFVVLGEDGKTVGAHNSSDGRGASSCSLGPTVDRMFPTPINYARAVLYYDATERRMFYSTNVHEDVPKWDYSATGHQAEDNVIVFQNNERVLQIDWMTIDPNTDQAIYVAAVLTNKRLWVMDADFKIMVEIDAPPNSNEPFFTSCQWFEQCLLYSTDTHIRYLSMDGSSHTICAVHEQGSIIAGALNDRVLTAATVGGRTDIRQRPFNVLQSLLMGVVTMDVKMQKMGMAEPSESRKALKEQQLKDIVSYYGKYTHRLNSDVINAVDSYGFPDLAYDLLAHAPQMTPANKVKIGLRAHKFNGAFENLCADRKRVRESGRHANESVAREFSILFQRLAEACIYCGQFAVAHNCLVELDDDESRFKLLNLYEVTGLFPHVETLAEKSGLEGKYVVEFQRICKSLMKLHEEEGEAIKEGALVDWLFESSSTKREWGMKTGVMVEMRAQSEDDDMDADIIPPLLVNTVREWMGLPRRGQDAYDNEDAFIARSRINASTENGGDGPEVDEDGFMAQPDLASEFRSTAPFSKSNVQFSDDEEEEDFSKFKVRIRSETTEKDTSSAGGFSFPSASFNLPDPNTQPSPEPAASSTSSTAAPPPGDSTAGGRRRRRGQSTNAQPVEMSGDFDPRGSFATTAVAFNIDPNEKINTPTKGNEYAEPPPIVTGPDGQSPSSQERPKYSGPVVTEADDLASSEGNPADHAKSALSLLSSGDFHGGLREVETALMLIAGPYKAGTGDTSKLHKQIMFCKNYKIALQILIDLRELEFSTPKDYLRIAVLHRVLSEMRLKGQHEVLVATMGVRSNMEARNFGLAAQIIDAVLPKSQGDDQVNFQNLIQECERNNRENSNVSTFRCPGCRGNIQKSVKECDSCRKAPVFCLKNFDVIPESRFLVCNTCQATFDAIGTSQGSICPVCSIGETVNNY